MMTSTRKETMKNDCDDNDLKNGKHLTHDVPVSEGCDVCCLVFYSEYMNKKL